MSDTFQKIRRIDWEKRWMLTQIPVVSALLLAIGYERLLRKDFGKNLHQNIFVFNGTGCVNYQSARANVAFGAHVGKTFFYDARTTRLFVKSVEQIGDALWSQVKRLRISALNLSEYRAIKKLSLKWFSGYIGILRGANHLSSRSAKKIFSILNEYRSATEELYPDVCRWFENALVRIARDEKIPSRYLRLLSDTELESYLKNGSLPHINDLKSRYPVCGYFFEKGKGVLLSKKDVERFEHMLDMKNEDASSVSGKVAHPGKVTGTIRIVHDPRTARVFHDGDILVTEMTHPEFVPLMNKAGAIVTDAGGILCHAAIVSRELKKPCVIGTQRATRIFKTGDRVLVDADRGMVQKMIVKS